MVSRSMFGETELDLKYEITHCPNIYAWFTDPRISNPCCCIIASQGLSRERTSFDRLQLPEPWQGHLDQARILFLSSNPSIDLGLTDLKPNWSSIKEDFRNTYDNSFDQNGGNIIDGRYYRTSGGKCKVQPFWASVKKRAIELLQRDVEPGVDYALAEVVHCKSLKARGVREAAETCAHLYLKRVIAMSVARLIVVLGRKIPQVVKKELDIAADMSEPWGLWGPAEIVGRRRYIAFLGHPGSGDPKTFKRCVADPEKLQELRSFLRA